MANLEWEDNKIVNEGVVSEEEGVVIEPICSPQNGENEEINIRPHEERNKVPPRWTSNYVTGEGLSEESEEEDANINLHYLALFTSDPVHFEEAVKHDKWRTAMDIEIQAIEKNNTWELIDLPKDTKKIRVKWVYKTKLKENGEVDKLKARLVAKGYVQQ